METAATEPFDAARATLGKPDSFPRFRTAGAVTVAARRLPDRTPLVVFERGGEQRGLLLRQLVFHHVVQGTLAGEPYIVTF